MRTASVALVGMLTACNAGVPMGSSPGDAGSDAGRSRAPVPTPMAGERDSGGHEVTSADPTGGLLDIRLSVGRLNPAFDVEHAHYRVDVPLWVEHVDVEAVTDGDPEAILIGGSAPQDAMRVGLSLGQNTLEVTDTGLGASFTVDIYRAHAIVEELYGKARIPNAMMQFGHSVAVSGDLIAVGAPGDATLARGVNGSESELGASLSGAVFVLRYDGAGWEQEAFLKAHNADSEDRFGTSVALSGTTLVVGAPAESGSSPGVDGRDDDEMPSAGAGYVFELGEDGWEQTAYLKAGLPGTGDNFGGAVATDGERIVVGAFAESSSRAGVDASARDMGAAYSGAAYVFERDGASWVQAAYLKASNPGAGDQFGQSVALFGETVVVGAVGEQSDATGVDGDDGRDALFAAGAAYVFETNGAGSWRQTAYLKASNTGEEQRFGSSVSVSVSAIAVGAFTDQSKASGIGGDESDESVQESGAVYLFEREAESWEQVAYVKASNSGERDHFGQRVILLGDTLVVGANLEASGDHGVNAPQNDDGSPGAGAVYVFFRDDAGQWGQAAYLKASNPATGDNFGFGLGFDGVTLVAGAPHEDNGKGGLLMEPSPNDELPSAGAIYGFR